MNRAVLLVLCALSLVVCGCGSARSHPVSGTVIFEDNKPARELAGGTVSFESVADKSNASGEIQADGTFRINSQAGGDGVPAGRYRVLVMPPEPDDPDRRPPPLLDPRYQAYDTSGIEVSIEEKTTSLPIQVKRARR